MPSDVPKSVPPEKKAFAAVIATNSVGAFAMLAIVGSVCAFVFGAIDVFVFAGILVSGILAVIVAVVIMVFAYNKHSLSPPSPKTHLNEDGALVTEYAHDLFLGAVGEETRSQVTSVTCVTSDGGRMQLRVVMNGKLCHVDVDDIESAGIAFPKMKTFKIEAQLPENLTFNGDNFRELQVISFKNARTSETFSLTMAGEFDALISVNFSQCNDMRNLNFSGENLTSIGDIAICECKQLTSVAGMWDGDRPLLDLNPFQRLDLLWCTNLSSEGVANWLATRAKKYEIGGHTHEYAFDKDGRKISVTLVGLKNSPTLTSFSELTDLYVWIYDDPQSQGIHIPHRNSTGGPWSVNIGAENGFSLTTVSLFFDGGAVELSPQNATGTHEARAGRIDADGHKLHIAINDPVEKVIFKNKPAEPLTVALTKKSPLLTVEFPSLEAVPEEMLLKVTNCAGGGANPGVELKIAGQIVDLWRKDGEPHFLAVEGTMDTTDLNRSGWEKMENGPNGFVEGNIVLRRANFC